MKRCAFLTLETRGNDVIDDELALAPLTQLGWQACEVSWRQKLTPWSEFDLVVIRSTWDYWQDSDFFLETLFEIDHLTRLQNPLPLIRWNLAKTYLQDMQQQGVHIVPTLWSRSLQREPVHDLCDELQSDNLVIKPLIGANGVDAFRLSRECDARRLRQLQELYQHRPIMVQAFMPAILNEGEYSLFYFNGVFSHAILKRPAQGEFRSQEERGAEIRAIEPEALLLQRGAEALAIITPPPLYARIDFVRTSESEFALMECELIEPSMYLRTDSQAPARFAHAIDQCFNTI